MTDEEKDRINRAEEIQRYTENRCETLEKENAELKAQIENKNSLLDDIIDAFTSQSLTDDYEMECTAREIAEILGIQNYR